MLFALLLAVGALAVPHKRAAPIYNGAQVSGKTYDYIIVGGGLSGSVLAARLSTDASVLLLEAGYDEEGRADVTDPSRYTSTFDTWLDWAFKTVPQTGGSVQTVRAGRGLGGSTLINGMAWSKPESFQLDALADVGNADLTWSTLQPYMIAVENFKTPSSAQLAGGITYSPSSRGAEGLISTQHVPGEVPNSLERALNSTVQNLGLPYVTDLTSGRVGGAAPISHTRNGNTRIDAYRAYLWGKSLPNLTILAGANAGKVLLSSGSAVATGVEFKDENGVVYSANAGREVIVSAGAIKTPLLLQHSGIGPASVLSAAGVPVRVDTPAGQNLIDQTLSTTSYSFSGSRGGGQDILFPRFADIAGGDAARLRGMLENDLESYVQDAVSAGAAGSAAGLRKVLEIQRNWVLQRNAGVAELYDYSWGSTLAYDTWYLLPFGRGSVKITNNDAYSSSMSLNPRFMANPFDRLAAGATARYSRTVSRASPLSNSITGEQSPGGGVGDSLDSWANWVQSSYRSNWHPIGTAPMMSQSLGGVVDSRHRVYGVQKLRVVDGSNLPFQVSSHLMSVLYGLAERAANLITADHVGNPGPTSTTSSSSAGPGPTAAGVRAIHPNGDNSKCLQVSGAFANGSPVTVANCNGSAAQKWEVTGSRIKSAGQNYCLDAGSNPANGVGMKIWTCYDGLAAQSWSWSGSGSIKLVSANQCIDRQDGGSGVQTWQCYAENTNQRWT